jgi:competence protein ComEC
MNLFMGGFPMKIYTLNVGQGQFVVVVGDTEAIIVDTSIPLSPAKPIVHVKSALADILKGKNLVGLMITGFDADHFNEVGVKIALHKYRPNWIMYPKYFKDSKVATAGFAVIKEFEKEKEFTKYSISLSENDKRHYTKLSDDFSFEVFSPHKEDMDSSNNCSLVCKITEKSSGGTYLVTGDTENNRWESITKIFGDSIKSDVLDAPHHGSKNGITNDAIKLIKPDTVLISAGVDNSYGHPDAGAITAFKSVTKKIYSTNDSKDGRSILTEISKGVSGIVVMSKDYLPSDAAKIDLAGAVAAARGTNAPPKAVVGFGRE